MDIHIIIMGKDEERLTLVIIVEKQAIWKEIVGSGWAKPFSNGMRKVYLWERMNRQSTSNICILE